MIKLAKLAGKIEAKKLPQDFCWITVESSPGDIFEPPELTGLNPLY